MSAQTLREAAKVLRERAGAADLLQEPWAIWPDVTVDGFVHVGNVSGVIPEGEAFVDEANPVAKVYIDEFASYIAMMHPGVGLALAKWIDDIAAGWIWDEDPDDVETPDGWPVTLDESMDSHALNVARLILGGGS